MTPARRRPLRYREEGWHTNRKGERFFAEISCFIRQSPKGDHLGTTTIIRDLTGFVCHIEDKDKEKE